MADNDLKEFERSLAQLEYMADKSVSDKRQSNTRNTESRTKDFNINLDLAAQ